MRHVGKNSSSLALLAMTTLRARSIVAQTMALWRMIGDESGQVLRDALTSKRRCHTVTQSHPACVSCDERTSEAMRS